MTHANPGKGRGFGPSLAMALIATGLPLGYLLGRQHVADAGRWRAGEAARAEERIGKPTGDGETTDGATTTRRKRANNPGSDQEPRAVEVPIVAAASLIKQTLPPFDYQETLLGELPMILGWLGATDEQKERVAKVLEKSIRDTREAERLHARVTRTERTEAVLDLSGARAAIEAITARTQQGLREALEENAAATLIEGIPWEFARAPYETEEITFRIHRDAQGRLASSIRAPKFSFSGFAIPPGLPASGPIPADKVFEKRWGDLLPGVMIEPEP